MNRFYVLIMILSCVWPVLLSAQIRVDKWGDKPIATKHDLKGQVKRITQTQSPISNKAEDWLDGFSGQNYTEEYNRQGYLQKRTAHDDFNKSRTATYYEYDANGRVISLQLEELAPGVFNGRTEGRIDYEYDDNRNAFIVHDNRTIMGKAVRRRTETIRDTVNRILMTLEYQQDMLLTRDQRYWWDKWGYVTKQINRYRNLPPSATEINKEDFKRLIGSLSKEEEHTSDSLMQAKDSLQTQEYKSRSKWTIDTLTYQNGYDKQGRLVFQESHRSSKRINAVRFIYDQDVTQVIHQSFDQKGNLISENISRQHPVDRHILTDSSRHKVDGKWETRNYNYENYSKTVYQYQYDAHGNWIEQKQIDAVGKQIGVLLVRTIEYY